MVTGNDNTIERCQILTMLAILTNTGRVRKGIHHNKQSASGKTFWKRQSVSGNKQKLSYMTWGEEEMAVRHKGQSLDKLRGCVTAIIPLLR